MQNSFQNNVPCAGFAGPSAPQSLAIISRCGVNGHLAFGCFCEASMCRNASCAPVISAVLPSCSFNFCATSSTAPQRSSCVRPQSVGCVSSRSRLYIAIRIWRTGNRWPAMMPRNICSITSLMTEFRNCGCLKRWLVPTSVKFVNRTATLNSRACIFSRRNWPVNRVDSLNMKVSAAS